MVEEAATMKFKGTAWMAAGFLSLVLYYFFVDLPAEQKENTKKERAEKLLPLDAEKVVEFSLSRNDSSITLRRNDPHSWSLTHPLSATGDSAEVETFLSEIGSLKKTRVVENNPKDLSIYGLSSPFIKIHFKFENKSEETLLVGNESPMGGHLYFKRENQPPVMLAATSKSRFEKSVYTFRDKSLLHFSAGNIRRIQITRKNDPLEFKKNDEGWKISEPVGAQGDKDAIMNFLQSIQFSKVQEFIDEDPPSPEPYGLKHPKLKLALENEKGEIHTLALGNPKEDKGYFGKINDAPNIVMIGTKLFETLSQKVVAFLDKTLFEFEEKEILELSLRSKNETIHMVREKDDKWGIQSPIKTAADLSTINSLLFDLKEAKITEFIKISLDIPEVFGLITPQKSLTLKMKDRKTSTLEFGNQTSDGKQVFAKRQDESTVFLISQKVVNKLFRNLYDLRNKKLLEFESTEVNKIGIKTPNELFELMKRDTEWNLEKPEKIKTQHIGHDLIWTLKGLEFKSIIDPPLPENLAGLDTPAITISLWGSDQREVATLKIGKFLDKEQEYIAQTGNQQYRIKNKYIDSIPLSIEKFKP
jgi:hypothetical protein